MALPPRGLLVEAARFGTLAVMGLGQTELRLIGVHENGTHLLLSDGDGGRYLLPLDETLKAAARRDRPRMGQLQIEIDGAIRPREVQALMRTGMTAEEIADRTGWSAERIRRYEGPVLAEREYAANLAQQVYVRGGSNPIMLGTRVNRRLHNRDVDPDSTSWDAVRSEEGNWTVTLTFAAGGRERTATWYFDLEGRSVVAANDEARWLSEESTPSGPIPAPHPHGSDDDDDDVEVFDVEADGNVTSRRRSLPEPIDLMQAMRDGSARNRRRRRRASGSPTDLPLEPTLDALPLEEIDFDPGTMGDPPGARGPHPDDAEHEAEVEVETGPGDEPGIEADDTDQPEAVEQPATDATDSADDTDRPGDDDVADEEPVSDQEPVGDPEPQDEPAPPEQPRRPKSKRPSVPSWDDIMFGSRTGDQPPQP